MEEPEQLLVPVVRLEEGVIVRLNTIVEDGETTAVVELEEPGVDLESQPTRLTVTLKGEAEELEFVTLVLLEDGQTLDLDLQDLVVTLAAGVEVIYTTTTAIPARALLRRAPEVVVVAVVKQAIDFTPVAEGEEVVVTLRHLLILEILEVPPIHCLTIIYQLRLAQPHQ